LEGAVVVKVEAGELANAELAIDVHAGVDFLAAVAVGFEAVAGFEQLDLGRVLCFLRRSSFLGLFVGGLFDWLLSRLLRGGNASDKRDE